MKYFNSLFLLLGLLCCLAFGLQAQGTDRISKGEARLNLSNEDLTHDQGCQKCYELAQINAIEKAFGTVMIQGNYTYIRNVQEQEEVETTQVFSMMAESLVNGEWIETIKDTCYNRADATRGEIWLHCEVKGRVRKLEEAPIDLKMEALDCPQPGRCETENFKEGENLYIAVTSPVRGYVTLYLSLGDSLQKLLPYYTMPRGMEKGIPVAPNETYVFFSHTHDRFNLGNHVHELELFADAPEELNRLYLIYSEEPLKPPVLSKGTEEVGYILPMEISYRSFQRWLAKQRKYKKDIYVVKKDITIRK